MDGILDNKTICNCRKKCIKW